MAKLGDICNILDSRRKPVSKSNRVCGIYPYYGANGIQDFVDNYIFDGEFLLIGEDGSVINKDNSPVVHWAKGKIWVNNHAHILSEQAEKAKLRFIYHALHVVDVSDIVRGVPPKINQANMRDIEIPLPSIEEQQRIVDILDKFEGMVKNVEKELELRQKQYEFYKDAIISSISCRNNMKLSQIADICTGSSNTCDGINDGKYKFYTRGQEVLTKNEYEFDDQSIITSGDGVGVGKVFHLTDGKYALHQRAYRINIKDRNVSTKYVYYYFISNFYNYICMKSFFASVTSVRKPMLLDFEVPIPSLETQNTIVAKLDKFEAIIANLKRELELRKRQYEYYREKLLTFE